MVELVEETARTRSIVLDLPEWPGHRAGQHVDVRLTAEDGYQAQRSYSIASAPEDEQLVLTVERLDDGEVSGYLTDELRPGDELELRGPIGGYFVWERVARRPAPSRRRRLGRRPAPRDAPAPPGGRERRARAAALLGQDARRRDLPRRACNGGLSRRDRHPLRAHPRLARRLAGLSPPHRPGDARGGRLAAGREPPRLRLWPDRVRRGGGRSPRRARPPARPDQDRALRRDGGR